MTDVVTVACRFIQRYACSPPDIAPYSCEQIIKGWENFSVLPRDTAQFCTVTLTTSTRHGTNAYRCVNAVEVPDAVEWTTAETVEHVIQADFCGASPKSPPHITLARANQARLIAGDFEGVEFFARSDPRLSLLYCDDVMNFTGLDDTHLFSHRYQIKLHVSEVISRTLIQPGFDALVLKRHPV